MVIPIRNIRMIVSQRFVGVVVDWNVNGTPRRCCCTPLAGESIHIWWLVVGVADSYCVPPPTRAIEMDLVCASRMSDWRRIPHTNTALHLCGEARGACCFMCAFSRKSTHDYRRVYSQRCKCAICIMYIYVHVCVYVYATKVNGFVWLNGIFVRLEHHTISMCV